VAGGLGQQVAGGDDAKVGQGDVVEW